MPALEPNENRLMRAEQAIQREQQQSTKKKMDTAISLFILLITITGVDEHVLDLRVEEPDNLEC